MSKVSTARLKMRTKSEGLNLEISCSKEEEEDDEDIGIQGRFQLGESYPSGSGSEHPRKNSGVREDVKDSNQRGTSAWSSQETRSGSSLLQSHSSSGAKLNESEIISPEPVIISPDATNGLNQIIVLNQSHALASSESGLKSGLPASSVNNLYIVVGGEGFSRERSLLGPAHFQHYSGGGLLSTTGSNVGASFDGLRGLPASLNEHPNKLLREPNQLTTSGHESIATGSFQSSGQQSSLGLSQQIVTGLANSAAGSATGVIGGLAETANGILGSLDGLQASSGQQQLPNVIPSRIRNTDGSTRVGESYGQALGQNNHDISSGFAVGGSRGHTETGNQQLSRSQGTAFHEGTIGRNSDRSDAQYNKNQGQSNNEGVNFGWNQRVGGGDGYSDRGAGQYNQNQGQAFKQGTTSELGSRYSGGGEYSDRGSGQYNQNNQNQGQGYTEGAPSGLGPRGIGGGVTSVRVNGQSNQNEVPDYNEAAISGLGSRVSGGGGNSAWVGGQYNQNQGQAFNGGATSGLDSRNRGDGNSERVAGQYNQYNQNQGQGYNEAAISGLGSRVSEGGGNSARVGGQYNQNQGQGYNEGASSALGASGNRGGGNVDQGAGQYNQNQGQSAASELPSRGFDGNSVRSKDLNGQNQGLANRESGDAGRSRGYSDGTGRGSDQVALNKNQANREVWIDDVSYGGNRGNSGRGTNNQYDENQGQAFNERTAGNERAQGQFARTSSSSGSAAGNFRGQGRNDENRNNRGNTDATFQPDSYEDEASDSGSVGRRGGPRDEAVKNNGRPQNGNTIDKQNQWSKRTKQSGNPPGSQRDPLDFEEPLDLDNDYEAQADDYNSRASPRRNEATGYRREKDSYENGPNPNAGLQEGGDALARNRNSNRQTKRRKSPGPIKSPTSSGATRDNGRMVNSGDDYDYDDTVQDESPKQRSSGSKKYPADSKQYQSENNNSDYEEEPEEEETAPRKAGGSGRTDQSVSSGNPQRRRPASSKQPTGSGKSRTDSRANDQDSRGDDFNSLYRLPGKIEALRSIENSRIH